MRREKEITLDDVSDGNRDKGKSFLIREMPSAQAEAWAYRLLLSLSRAGADFPDDVFAMGFAGLALIATRGLMNIPWDEAKPLLDEMRGCIMIREALLPDGARKVTDDDIEEVSTWLRLREEALNLHLNFQLRDALSSLTLGTQTEDSENTSTSPEQ